MHVCSSDLQTAAAGGERNPRTEGSNSGSTKTTNLRRWFISVVNRRWTFTSCLKFSKRSTSTVSSITLCGWDPGSRSWPDLCIVLLGRLYRLFTVRAVAFWEKKNGKKGAQRWGGQMEREGEKEHEEEEEEKKKVRKPWSVTQYRRKCQVDKCNSVWSISYTTDYVKQLPCVGLLFFLFSFFFSHTQYRGDLYH